LSLVRIFKEKKKNGKVVDYDVEKIHYGLNIKYNKYSLIFMNQFPIQSILFSRKLYDDLGGMDVDFKAVEDWDLWLKFSDTWKLSFVNKTTSMFSLVGNKKTNKKRDKRMKISHENLYKKREQLKYELTGKELIELCGSIFEMFPYRKFQHDLDNFDTELYKLGINLYGGTTDKTQFFRLLWGKVVSKLRI
jgi:hypothetical protein